MKAFLSLVFFWQRGRTVKKMKWTLNMFLFLWLAICQLSVMTTQAKLRHKSDAEGLRRGRRAPLRITTVIMEPYLMINSPYINSTNSHLKYVGYIPDLLHTLSQLVGFSYEIDVVGDGEYGNRRADGWTGMVGELLRHNADMAAAPLFITPQRQAVIDFTIPFMKVSATVLLRKSPNGSDLDIKSASDLIGQSEIKYGTLSTGMIKRAFLTTNNTDYKKMWWNMEDVRPSVFTASNREGIDRVRQEKYAFIIPSTIGEYVEYMEPCDLQTVDSFLLNTAYGLAMRKNARLLPDINLGLSMLETNGELASLKYKWWYERRPCKTSKADKRSSRAVSALPPTGNYFTITLCIYITMCVTSETDLMGTSNTV